MSDDRARFTTRVRMTDDLRRNRQDPRAEDAHTPPLVIWRRSGCCRARLLRVFLTPEGWHVLVDGFRLTTGEWLERLGEPDADRRAVYLGGKRRVGGGEHTLPLDLAQWPQEGKFEVGCGEAVTLIATAVLSQHCAEARQTRGCVKRQVSPDGTVSCT